MRRLSSIRIGPASISGVWLGIAAAILIALLATAATSRIALANNLDRADLAVVRCETDGVHLSWRTENEGQAAAPDGWKIERSNQNSEGNQVVRTFTFIGGEQGSVLTTNGEYWGWVDTNVNRNVLYTYRVRAINADGSDMNGRNWSRNALVECSADPNVQPGISELRCQDDGVSMSWHTGNEGAAPDGWKVERSHQDAEGNWIVRTFTFIGSDADALQTGGDDSWNWVDTSADLYVDYSYRVRAINADGTDMAGRVWSRHASVFCTGGNLDQPGISVPRCQDNGISIFWHARNRGEAEAPEGWKVERRHWDSGEWVVRTFTFIGADSDALQTFNDKFWDWVDTSAEDNVQYTYRVRAINADGSDMDGRVWSRRAPVECSADPSVQPGISVPRCQDNGVSIYWHTRNRGEAEAPEGWKVERRHKDSGEWVVRTFTFIGADSDALQTSNDKLWDWVDTSAEDNVEYTYRVRAINPDGSDMDGRVWSRRAPVEC